MAKKNNTDKKGRKEGMKMIAKALIIPQENFDTLLEAMIESNKKKRSNKKKEDGSVNCAITTDSLH